MDVKKEIGTLIAQHRKQQKLTQERLAFLTDLHPDYIGKVERGERVPSVDSLLKIIKGLGMKYSSFFKELD
ncbi:MAG: helix-turn-helix transcriptional regulator [Bacteroidota bacterium]